MAKAEKTLAKDSLKAQNTQKKGKKVQANQAPKRNKIKETFGELKKVTWPSFKKTMKQTGMVISVVALFMLVTLGIDSLLNWILKLISNI